MGYFHDRIPDAVKMTVVWLLFKTAVKLQDGRLRSEKVISDENFSHRR